MSEYKNKAFSIALQMSGIFPSTTVVVVCDQHERKPIIGKFNHMAHWVADSCRARENPHEGFSIGASVFVVSRPRELEGFHTVHRMDNAGNTYRCPLFIIARSGADEKMSIAIDRCCPDAVIEARNCQ